MLGCSHELVHRCCRADAWNGHGEMSCVSGSWVPGKGRGAGVTVWQAGSNLSDKGPVPQHLNEGTAGPATIAGSRQESSDQQTSLVTKQVQGQVEKSRQSESSARYKA